MGMDEVDDGASQNIHVEGFQKISVGPRLKTLQTVLVTALGSKQDDRNMTRRRTALNLRTHGIAIHFRHHDIGNHQVRNHLEHFTEASLAVLANGDVIVV